MEAIDVFQKYQGFISWAQVYAAGVRAAFVKLTNGPIPASPTGDVYVTGAKRVKILVGGYAYALGSHTPESQAIAFAKELTRLNALDIAPALDFEDSSLPTTSAARTAWVVAFFRQLKKSMPNLTKALLYSSGSELAAMNIGVINVAVPGLTVMEWDAEYGPNDGKEHPVTHYRGVSAIHQYTSVGTVAGVLTKVDKNNITGNVTNPIAAPAQPQEADVQFGDKIPLTPDPGTVGFFMRDYLRGVGGSNSPGAMALDISNIAGTVKSLNTALTVVTGLLAAKNGLTDTDVYNAVVKALQENTVNVDVQVTGSPTTANPAAPQS